MTTIKTILVDDEPRGLSSLQKLLELNCDTVEIIATCSSAAAATDAIANLQPQLVFLDIAMPEANGFDLLHNLRAINFEIIFVTAHNNYMKQAFHFSAVDYLLKPVDDDLLKDAVMRAAKRIEDKSGNKQIESFLYNVQQNNRSQKMKLSLPSFKGYQIVEIKNIIYCEAKSNYTYFYFSDRAVFCASKPIHEYDELLSDAGFVRIHKSFLINIEHVKEYIRGEGGSVILSEGTEVEVSRRKKDLLMIKIKEYFKG